MNFTTFKSLKLIRWEIKSAINKKWYSQLCNSGKNPSLWNLSKLILFSKVFKLFIKQIISIKILYIFKLDLILSIVCNVTKFLNVSNNFKIIS